MQRIESVIRRRLTLVVAIDQTAQRRETGNGRSLSIVNETLQAWWAGVLGTSGRERIGIADRCHDDGRKVLIVYRAKEDIAGSWCRVVDLYLRKQLQQLVRLT